MPRDLLAVMITTTTYGTWLPGDAGGYVEHGRTLPPRPALRQHATRLLGNEPVHLSAQEQDVVFDALLDACSRYEYLLYCATVESWHLHWLIDSRGDATSVMVGRLKTAMRQALGRGRVWTKGYDERFCCSQREVEDRWAYISRHPGFRAVTPIV